jgi:regulator of sirC expression with transglutaminase-like and TPR domain
MFKQKDAIMRLLRDNDPETVNLVKEQLAEGGAEAIEELEAMLALEDDAVTFHVREVLAEIDVNEALDELALYCPMFPEHGDLEYGNWLVARAYLPGIDLKPYKEQIETWALEIAPLIQLMQGPVERVQTLGTFLGDELGFEGNTQDYYNADNMLLPRLLDSRLGIPISLTTLFMMIGQRAGMQIEGINFPGNFLARHQGIIFDPFEKGRILSSEDCEEILARQNVPATGEHFQAATPRMMFRRSLANLLYVAKNEGNERESAVLAGWIRGLDRK